MSQGLTLALWSATTSGWLPRPASLVCLSPAQP